MTLVNAISQSIYTVGSHVNKAGCGKNGVKTTLSVIDALGVLMKSNVTIALNLIISLISQFTFYT